MGRSFMSVRMDAWAITDRWRRSSRQVRPHERAAVGDLAAMGKAHASEAFFGCDGPLEAVLFSVLVGICREQEEETGNVDP